jgi:hypothetical protein
MQLLICFALLGVSLGYLAMLWAKAFFQKKDAACTTCGCGDSTKKLKPSLVVKK